MEPHCQNDLLGLFLLRCPQLCFIFIQRPKTTLDSFVNGLYFIASDLGDKGPPCF